MANLPIPPSSPAPAAVARAGANPSARGLAAREGGAQAVEDPFQAVLAQELELAPGIVPASGIALAPDGMGITGDTDLKASDDTLQTGTAGDAPFLPAWINVAALPFALAGTSTSPTARAGASIASTALAGASVSLAESGAASPLGRASARGGHAMTVALGSRQNQTGTTSAAAQTETPLSAMLEAADSAASGKFALTAASEGRREFAFDASLPEQPKPASATAAAIHAGSTAPAAAAAAPAPATALDPRVGAQGWGQGLGDKLVWMAGQSQQVAQLHLNPPELGPMEIRLTLNHDQASAQFVSTHALVREAIEAAMPRLREMLADNGITLGNANVSADAFQEQAQPQSQQQARAHAAQSGMAAAEAGTRGMQLLQLSRGLVDTFA